MAREQKSELQLLLEKNARAGLSIEEQERALKLIDDPIYSDEECFECFVSPPWYKQEKGNSIYDIHLCLHHAYEALTFGQFVDYFSQPKFTGRTDDAKILSSFIARRLKYVLKAFHPSISV